jgi:chitinase
MVYPAQRTVLRGNDIVVYLPNYSVQRGYSISKNLAPVARHIDYIVYAFAKPNPRNGTIVLDNPDVDIGTQRDGIVHGNFAELRRIKKQFPHIKILLSVGGWNYKDDFKTIADKRLFTKCAHSCVAILSHTTIDGKRYSYQGLFDGIDLDWEFDQKDAAQYSAAFERLSKKISEATNTKNKRYLYTVAIQPSLCFMQQELAPNLKKIASHVNWINLMTYNFHGLWEQTANFNAPIFCTTPEDKYCIHNVIKHLKTLGVPTKKIALGVPFYGHAYKGTLSLNNGLHQPTKGGADADDIGNVSLTISKPGNIRFYDIARIIRNKSLEYTPHWNKTTYSSWLYNKERKIFISYDGVRALKTKTNYCTQQKLGGIMVWEISGDTPSNILTRTINKALKNKTN